ncbi:hypothetical protein, partial [Ellagibacter isourolithinifaciens]|uniref:hypothetical protein n=1 Tax=Ellagibacter isourolithinifaciens TaxID=2137581 RepID=UPI003AACE5C9
GARRARASLSQANRREYRPCRSRVRPLTEKELAELESAWKEYCEIGTDMESQGLLVPGSAYSPLPRSAAFQ